MPAKSPDEMTFLEHLEELRWHIIRSLIAIAIFAVLAFLMSDFIFDRLILGPSRKSFISYRLFCQWAGLLCEGPKQLEVFTQKLGEQFYMHLKVSLVVGFIAAFPYVFYEMWKFVKPGLLEHERRVTRHVVSIASVLFLLGILFGYFVILPLAVSFLAGYSLSNVIANTVTLSSFVNTVVMVTLPAGVLFQLPLVVYFLSKIGVVTPDFMRRYRRHAIVLILIVAAIITPPDVITQILISMPLVLLYELSIYVSVVVYRKRGAQNP